MVALSMTTAILDRGADVNEELENGQYALLCCVFRVMYLGQLGYRTWWLMRLLISRGASVERRSRQNNKTPLQLAFELYDLSLIHI